MGSRIKGLSNKKNNSSTVSIKKKSRLNLFQKQRVFLLDQRKGALDYWRIVDRIIQEIALQQEDGSDPDMAPVDIHVKHIINKLVMLIFCHSQYDIWKCFNT